MSIYERQERVILLKMTTTILHIVSDQHRAFVCVNMHARESRI